MFGINFGGFYRLPILTNSIWWDWCIFCSLWLLIAIAAMFWIKRCSRRTIKWGAVMVSLLCLGYLAYDIAGNIFIELNYTAVLKTYNSPYSQSEHFWLMNLPKMLRSISVPGLAVFLCFALPIFLRARKRWRVLQGCCEECGYDCNNLPSSTCPECGRSKT